MTRLGEMVNTLYWSCCLMGGASTLAGLLIMSGVSRHHWTVQCHWTLCCVGGLHYRRRTP